MKLLREHLNEKFSDESDPIQDMGIGSKLVIFINKLDAIAKSFKFKKEDATSYQPVYWGKARVLAVWKRDSEEIVKLFNYKIDDIEDESKYWVAFDTGHEGGQDPGYMVIFN